jgi:hypothetical protein
MNQRTPHVYEDDADQLYFGVPIPIACFVKLGATPRRKLGEASTSPANRSSPSLAQHAGTRPPPVHQESGIDRRVVDFAAS